MFQMMLEYKWTVGFILIVFFGMAYPFLSVLQ